MPPLKYGAERRNHLHIEIDAKLVRSKQIHDAFPNNAITQTNILTCDVQL